MSSRIPLRRLQVESLEKRIALTADLAVDGNTAPVNAAQVASIGEEVYFSTNNGSEAQIRRFDGERLSTIAEHQVFGPFGNASPHFLLEVGDGVMYGFAEPFFEENIATATFQIWYVTRGETPQLIRELSVMDRFGTYQPPTGATVVDDNLLIRDSWSRFQLMNVEGDTLSSWAAPVEQTCGSPTYGVPHADAGGVVIEASYNCGSFLPPLYVRADEVGLQEVETHPGSFYLPNGTRVYTEEFRDTGAFELFFQTSNGVELINASGASLKPASLTRFGEDKIFFIAEDGSNGREPWITDGTRSGTHMLRNISGLESSDPEVLGKTPRGLVFSAFSESRGRELWITDGTAFGTRLLRDVRPGPVDGNPQPTVVSSSSQQQLIEVQSEEVHFWVDTGSGGRELWLTDGTSSGTVKAVQQVMVQETELTAKVELTDGTSAFGFSDSFGNLQVWIRNPTRQDAKLVAGLPSIGRVVSMAASTDQTFTILLESNEIWTIDQNGNVNNVWSNDAGIDTFGLNPKNITSLGSRILFTTDVDTKSRVWILDPDTDQLTTPGIIAMQRDITISVLGNREAVFTSFNVVRALSGGRLSALGTQLILQHETISGHSYLLSSNNELTIINDDIVSTRPAGKYFQLTPVANSLYALTEEQQLVRFDGSVPTLLAHSPIKTSVKLLPGPAGSLWIIEDGVRVQRFDLSTNRVVNSWAIDETLQDPIVNDDGKLFWRSIGQRGIRTLSDNGIVELRGIGDVTSFEEGLAIGSQVFFIGVNARAKRSLWTSDGTPEGTVRLGLIQGIGNLATDGQKLYFTGDGSLWESDGTTNGTVRSQKVQSELINSTADELEIMGRDLFFAASDGVHGKELFRVALDPTVVTPVEKPGDADGDGLVNFSDFLILSRDFGLSRSPSSNDADFDDDGVVNFTDFLILSGNFGS